MSIIYPNGTGNCSTLIDLPVFYILCLLIISVPSLSLVKPYKDTWRAAGAGDTRGLCIVAVCWAVTIMILAAYPASLCPVWWIQGVSLQLG